MATYFISRHPGSQEWAKRQGINACWVEHLDLDRIVAGDSVFGTLPVHLAAEVCRRGGAYVHLALDLPREARGKELTPEQMATYAPRLLPFRVEAQGRWPKHTQSVKAPRPGRACRIPGVGKLADLRRKILQMHSAGYGAMRARMTSWLPQRAADPGQDHKPNPTAPVKE